MNQLLLGDAGRTYTVSACFLAEREYVPKREHVVYCECTEKWHPALLSEAYADSGHCVYTFPTCASDVGDVYGRARLGALAVSPDIVFAQPLEDFLQYCGSAPAMSASTYFQPTAADDLFGKQGKARHRVVPVGPGEDLTWKDVLHPTQLLYIKACKDDFQAGVTKRKWSAESVAV